MADLRVTYNALTDEFDFDICRGTVFWDNGLQTAVMLSLFTDARARDDDEIPDGTDDRRGWWADTLSFDGIQFGSRRWLLGREKQQDVVLRKLEEYDSEALQWLLDRGIATRVEVTAEHAGPERWLETIRIYRNGDANPFEFAWLFERIERQTCRQKFEQPPPFIPDPLDPVSLQITNSTDFSVEMDIDSSFSRPRPIIAPQILGTDAFIEEMDIDNSAERKRPLQAPQINAASAFITTMSIDSSATRSRPIVAPSIGGATAFINTMTIDSSVSRPRI